MFSFAVTVVLNVVIKDSLDESKETLPDHREAMTRLNLVVRNAVHGGSCFCFLTAQNLGGGTDDLRKASSRATKAIDSLRRGKLYNTALADRSPRSFEVEQQKYQGACRRCCMVHERLGVE